MKIKLCTFIGYLYKPCVRVPVNTFFYSFQNLASPALATMTDISIDKTGHIYRYLLILLRMHNSLIGLLLILLLTLNRELLANPTGYDQKTN